MTQDLSRFSASLPLKKRLLFSAIRFMVLAAAGIGLASGGLIQTVSFDTAPLIGHPAGPFALEIQFNDGSGAGDGNNTALLSGFDFGGGGPAGTASVFGGAAGDLSSSIAITDSSFFNQFVQNFTPGAALSFQLNLSTNADSGGTPDEFSLAILDSTGFEIPTNGLGNALLIIDAAGTPVISAFATDTSRVPNAGGPAIDIAAPSVFSSGIPEPPTWALLPTGLMAAAIVTRLRRS